MSSRPSRGAARLAAILDALPDALLLVNCNGTVVNANTIALEAFETPGTALVGRGLLDLLPEFDSKRIPGSMRRPDEDEQTQARQKPTRMVARRTDGTDFPVEVTSANLEDGRTPYASAFEAAFSDHGLGHGSGNTYTGDELLMLVVRDLTGTLDTEAELARQQRQTEMILRAASEGVVGVDTEGRIVLVNPAAAQILGYRAGDLGGQELAPLVHHSRPDGAALPYEETPLADTLRSGRKHRVKVGQVLWAKNGRAVPVDMTTAPVRDGEQLVGAVMTFADRRPYEALSGRHEQLLAVLDNALRGPLDQLRTELAGLAADPAGQLWPEANQILHHLAAGYARMTTLVDNVLGYQRLDAGRDKLRREKVALDAVVANGVEGAVELIGPGRAQFAVHAPPIEAEVDPERLATALAHLIADVAGVDATGNSPVAAPAGVDPTIVVAAANRGDVVRIEVRGPYGGGNPVHEPIVRGIIRQHGGVLQTHDVPGAAGGSAYVLEVPVSSDSGGKSAGSAAARSSSDGADGGTAQPAGAVPADGAPATVDGAPADGGPQGAQDAGGAHGDGGTGEAGGDVPRQRDGETTVMPVPDRPVRGMEGQSAPVMGSETSGVDGAWGAGTGPDGAELPGGPEGASPVDGTDGAGSGEGGSARPTGRRRGRPSAADEQHDQAPPAGDTGARGSALALPAAEGAEEQANAPDPEQGSGRRARRTLAAPGEEPQPGQEAPGDDQSGTTTAGGRRARRLARERSQGDAPEQQGVQGPEFAVPGSMQPVPAQPQGPAQAQAAQAQAAGREQPQAGPFALPPGGGAAQQMQPQAQAAPQSMPYEARQAVPAPEGAAGAGRELEPATAAAPEAVPQEQQAQPRQQARPAQQSAQPQPAPQPTPQPETWPEPQQGPQQEPQAGGQQPEEQEEQPARPAEPSKVAGSPILGGGAPEEPRQQPNLPAPVEAPNPGARVRTLGQGVPFAQRIAEQPGRPGQSAQAGQPQQQGGQAANALPAPAPAAAIPSTPSTPAPPAGSGRRRKLATPPEDEQEAGQQEAGQQDGAPGAVAPRQPHAGAGPMPQPQQNGGRAAQQGAPAREFAIGAPDAGAAEGPEPLDGPDSPVEVTDGRGLRLPPQDADDELPPEPLDNPRRLLVWPEPDGSTQQALSDRGYRPVIVHSREEVDAQIAAYPAALFVDPLTGPITRTALQSLRTAAVAAEVPVLVTAGLGQATREAAYGADPAVLLKALAPRDSEQHPPRVLLVEEREPIAAALTASLERRGMHVAHAPSDSDAATVAEQSRPNLVVMDLMQVRKRRAGIIDWLRVNGLLNRTPFVVYTSADLDPAELPRLASGETVLFLAERSTSGDVQARIVDLLTKIGT